MPRGCALPLTAHRPRRCVVALQVGMGAVLGVLFGIFFPVPA